MISTQKIQEKPRNCCTLCPISLASSFSRSKLWGLTPCPPFSVAPRSSSCPRRGDPGASASSRAPGTLPSCHRRMPSFKGVTDSSCSLLHQGLQSVSVSSLLNPVGRGGPGFLRKMMLANFKCPSLLVPPCLGTACRQAALWEGFQPQSITWRKEMGLSGTPCSQGTYIPLFPLEAGGEAAREPSTAPDTRPGLGFPPGTALSWRLALSPANPLWPGATG